MPPDPPKKLTLSAFAIASPNPKMAPRSLNLVDLHRKFYSLPWLACGRYKLIRQSVEMTLPPPPPPEEFPEDGPDARENVPTKLDLR